MKNLFALIFLIASSGAFCMEYTKGFALQTPSGTHVGFVLGAPSFKEQIGDCVFMLLPEEADLVDSPLGILISELKVTGEHQWEKNGANIRIFLNTENVLEITDQALVLDATGRVIGKAVAIPEKVE
ncbi:hypothetical protein [Shewanella baltica]|uniref:hypothetical protein n=1 Tax=Shewanella baltica TaxID=62322 RepID=UPI000255489B|nr:hypothetical protein [Shewanella baltica]